MRKPMLVAIVGVLVTAGLATLVAGGVKRRSDVKAAPSPRQQLDARLAVDRERQLFEMKGTQVTPHPDLKDRDERLLKEICRQFAQQAPVPPQRMEYFRWADRSELGLRGWACSLQSVEPSPNGWFIQVTVSPHLVSRQAAVVYTTSKYIENYEVTPQGVRFISGEPMKGPQLLLTD